MKKVTSILLCISCVLFGDEFTTPVCEFQVESLIKEKEAQKWNLLPYAHLEAVIPGIGLCLRMPKEKLQYEINFKIAGFPYTFSGPMFNFYSASVSILPSIHKTEHGQFYFGTGAGVSYVNDFGDESIGPMAPLFLGYEGEQIFVDLGADVMVDQKIHFIAVPTMRMGLKF